LTSCFGPFGLYLIGKVGRPTSPTAASASPNSRPTQVNGQGGVAAQTQYVLPNSSKSAHDQPASDPAQPARQPAYAGLEEESETRPAQKSAQADSVPPAREQPCSRDKSAHESAQASLREGARSAQFQPAHDLRQDAHPPIGEPAQSLINCRAGQTKRPARRDVGAAHGPSSKVVSLSVADERREALNAVRSFVAILEHAPSARATGSALADAYEALRAGQGWPEVPRNIFGILLRIAVEEVGGRKLKSGSQVYEGVRISAGWGMQVAA
jgi:hypothetical protein